MWQIVKQEMQQFFILLLKKKKNKTNQQQNKTTQTPSTHKHFFDLILADPLLELLFWYSV